MGKMKNERVDESRVILEKAFYFALGSYGEQEAKKVDVWRDQTYGQLYAHLKHELQEVKRSNDRRKQIHNLVDMTMLSTILLAHVMLESGLLKGEEKEDE